MSRFLPIHTVRRLYEDQTLEVIEDLLGGPFDKASDALATQCLDPEHWRSMHKGPLCMTGDADRAKSWAFARALAYDRYLPTVVLGQVQNMQKACNARGGSIEVVYFPDAIGILRCGANMHLIQELRQSPQAYMCLVTRDIHRPEDFVHRYEPFERTIWRWLDHLHAESVPCHGLKLPRIEHLERIA